MKNEAANRVGCLACSTEIYWPHLHDDALAELVLQNKVKAAPTSWVAWWLDESLREHTASGTMDVPQPQFECVVVAGMDVECSGIGKYTVRRFSAGAKGER